jgi:hypothetical protein
VSSAFGGGRLRRAFVVACAGRAGESSSHQRAYRVATTSASLPPALVLWRRAALYAGCSGPSPSHPAYAVTLVGS